MYWQKYTSLIRSSFSLSITYRTETFLWFFLDLLPFVILMLVWVSLYQGTSQINEYSLGSVLQYYFLVMILNAIASHHFEQYRVKQIREGQIDYYLTKPLHFPSQIALSALGIKLFYIGVTCCLAVLSFLILQLVLPLTLPTPSAAELFQFSLLLVGAYLLEFYIGLFIVLAGFWFENAEGLEHFKWITITLFSGQLIPLTFMPGWMAAITNALPLKFISAVPIGVMQQTITLNWLDWIFLAGTLLCCHLLANYLWKLGSRKYSSAGG